MDVTTTAADDDNANDDEAAASTADNSGIRTKLPAEMKPRSDFNVWQFLKNCIGKELTRISMPVHFNEPLSFLQRVSEYLEYASLLHAAADEEDDLLRLELVSAFAVSGASSNADRLGKPFNPLLGETFELDRREDLGFRVICEQVSHHPPTSAFHAEAADGSWRFHGAITPKLSFSGRSVEVNPKGLVTVELTRTGELFSWNNVLCKIHNVVLGSLWLEHHGQLKVRNHSTGFTCDLKFYAAQRKHHDCNRVQGFVMDSEGKRLRAVYGNWTECLSSMPIEAWKQRPTPSNRSASHSNQQQQQSPNSTEPDDTVSRQLWHSAIRPANSQSYYSFTKFACSLNAPPWPTLPPTDSRRRPDMRALELGDLQLAQAEKQRLEEKQRRTAAARGRSSCVGGGGMWFELAPNSTAAAAAAAAAAGSEKQQWRFRSDYWMREWGGCPDIF